MDNTGGWPFYGDPTDYELRVRMQDYKKNGNPGLIHLECPNCQSTNTFFLRNTYWICFNCELIWDTNDTEPAEEVNEVGHSPL